MSYTLLDLSTWNRHEHYKFYQGTSQPWFNICSNVDASRLMQTCKGHQLSFFHAYLYLTQVAVNQHLPFKYRMVGQELRIYDNISVSCAILADDETMRFCDLPYGKDFSSFAAQAKVVEQHVKATPFMMSQFVGQEMAHDVIHMSVIPWIHFTSFSNARSTDQVDSIPKIIYGKAKKTEQGLMMPLSVEVHHGVMDGLHVGRFFDTIQQLFDQPESLLG